MATTDSGPGKPSPSSSSGTRPSEASLTFAGDAALERFAKSFESSARRWEMVVYPSLFAFIVLAAYGFFLIYSLTKDMHTLASSIDPRMQPHMETMANNIERLSINIETMTGRIDQMAGNIKSMESHVDNMSANVTLMTAEVDEISEKMNILAPMHANMLGMNQNMSAMNKSLLTMNQSMRAMTVSTGAMSQTISAMNYNVGRPMSMMNSFFPW